MYLIMILSIAYLVKFKLRLLFCGKTYFLNILFLCAFILFCIQVASILLIPVVIVEEISTLIVKLILLVVYNVRNPAVFIFITTFD